MNKDKINKKFGVNGAIGGQKKKYLVFQNGYFFINFGKQCHIHGYR